MKKSFLAFVLVATACSSPNQENTQLTSIVTGQACLVDDFPTEGFFCRVSSTGSVFRPVSELVDESLKIVAREFPDQLKAGEKVPAVVYRKLERSNHSQSSYIVRLYPSPAREIEVHFRLDAELRTWTLPGNGAAQRLPEIQRVFPDGDWGIAGRGEYLRGRLGYVSAGRPGSCAEMEAAITAFDPALKSAMAAVEDLGIACVAELKVLPFTEMKVIHGLRKADPLFEQENGGQSWPNRVVDTKARVEEVLGLVNTSLLEAAEIQKSAREALVAE